MIDRFTGRYSFLSNFYSNFINWQGIIYMNAEAAFQATKCKREEDKFQFSLMSPSKAKRYGQKVELRNDWNFIKDRIMYEIIKIKFSEIPMKDLLLATGDEELIEGNTWNDTYWGMCNGIGRNKLGNILMKVRQELKNK